MKIKQKYSKINSLKKIEEQRRIVETKLKIRKYLINKHVRNINDDFSSDYIFRQSLKMLKIDNPLYEYVPNMLKGIKPSKKIIIPIFSGIVATVASFVLLRKKSSKNKNSATQTSD